MANPGLGDAQRVEFVRGLMTARQAVRDAKRDSDLKAEAVAVIFDSKRLNFRNDIYADYKANRPDPPDDLIPDLLAVSACRN